MSEVPSHAEAPDGLAEYWRTFGEMCRVFYTAGDDSKSAMGDRWFAALSGKASSELNIAGLLPGATPEDAHELLSFIGPEQATLLFTSSQASDTSRQVFVEAGYEIAETREPIMRLVEPPPPEDSSLTVTVAASSSDLERALHLSSRAHAVDETELAGSIGKAASQGVASVLLAWDGDEAISTVWSVRIDGSFGVMEMMTPTEYQRRGAGRTLLTQGIRRAWAEGATESLLLSTPAGRRLYESAGFVAVDEGITCHRGMSAVVMQAIGQP